MGLGAFAALVIWQLFPTSVVSTSRRTPTLSRLYAELQARTASAAAAGAWPEAGARSALRRGLRTGPDGMLSPVRFATDGPLQCAAFFQCTACEPLALHLVAAARRQVFKPLVDELLAVLPSRARARVAAGLHWPSQSSLHMVVSPVVSHVAHTPAGECVIGRGFTRICSWWGTRGAGGAVARLRACARRGETLGQS